MKAALPFSWSMLNIFCFTFSSRAMRFCFSAGVSCLFASAKAAAAAASFLAFSRAASFARFLAASAAFFSAFDWGILNVGSPKVSMNLCVGGEGEVATSANGRRGALYWALFESLLTRRSCIRRSSHLLMLHHLVLSYTHAAAQP